MKTALIRQFRDNEGYLPWHRACQNKNVNLEVIQLLTQNIFKEDIAPTLRRDTHLIGSPNLRATDVCWSALHVACLNPSCSIEIVQFLINQGADLELKNEDDCTPFHYACHSINPMDPFELLNILIKAYTNVENLKNIINSSSKNKLTPMHIACKNRGCTVALLSCLVENGAELNPPNLSGQTPLHYLLQQSCPPLECIQYLVQKGAILNALDNYDLPPLAYLCMNPSATIESIKFLGRVYNSSPTPTCRGLSAASRKWSN